MSKNKYPYIARGNQRYVAFRSETFNIDSGTASTVDDVIFSDLPTDAIIVEVHPVYLTATDTAGAASATYSLGTTAGGVDIVAAVALEVSKAVGAAGAAATIAVDRIAAGGTLFARHSGIAATEAGTYYLQILVMLAP